MYLYVNKFLLSLNNQFDCRPHHSVKLRSDGWREMAKCFLIRNLRSLSSTHASTEWKIPTSLLNLATLVNMIQRNTLFQYDYMDGTIVFFSRKAPTASDEIRMHSAVIASWNSNIMVTTQWAQLGRDQILSQSISNYLSQLSERLIWHRRLWHN